MSIERRVSHGEHDAGRVRTGAAPSYPPATMRHERHTQPRNGRHSCPESSLIKKGPTGKFRFSLVSTNGQIVASSQAYENKAAAMRGVASVQKLAADARIVDTTVAAANALSEACREEAGSEEARSEEVRRQAAGRPRRSKALANRWDGAPEPRPPIGFSESRSPIGGERSFSTVAGSARCIRLGACAARTASRSSATISPTRSQISGTLPALSRRGSFPVSFVRARQPGSAPRERRRSPRGCDPRRRRRGAQPVDDGCP